MEKKTPIARTLARAAEILGGVPLLAARLKAPVYEVERWIEGIPPPPENRIFLLALDIVACGNLR